MAELFTSASLFAIASATAGMEPLIFSPIIIILSAPYSVRSCTLQFIFYQSPDKIPAAFPIIYDALFPTICRKNFSIFTHQKRRRFASISFHVTLFSLCFLLFKCIFRQKSSIFLFFYAQFVQFHIAGTISVSNDYFPLS